jgi:micrococcal nuclease
MSKRNVRRKKVPIYTMLIAAAIVTLIYYAGPHETVPAPANSTTAVVEATGATTTNTTAVVETTGAATTGSIPSTTDDSDPIYTDTAIKVPDAGMEGLKSGGYIKAKVIKVVDGDTVNVKYKSSEYKVRLLCIDTPESVKKGVAIQPYGVEASNFMKKEVLGKDVTLIFDKGLRDKYGRLLAFVIVGNGVNINAMLVGEGYARVEIVKPNSTFEDYFYELEQKAIGKKLGLWGLPSDEQPFVKDKNGYYIPSYYIKEKAS